MRLQRYQFLSLWCLLCLVADQSLGSHSVSLPQTNPIILEAKIYTNLACPYALMVRDDLIQWCHRHPQRRCHEFASEPPFPSPSLRMRSADYYINFIGVVAIQEGITKYP